MSSLKRALLLSFGLAVTGMNCAKQEEEKLEGLELTGNEKDANYRLFNVWVDNNKVRKIYESAEHPDGSPNVIATTNFKQQIRYYKGYHASDYTQTNVMNTGTHFHEMTHIFQLQRSTWSDAGKSCNGYDYYGKLMSDVAFSNMCVEEQAALIEDYTRRFLHQSAYSGRIWDTWFTDQQMKKTVEAAFPFMGETRRLMESGAIPKFGPNSSAAVATLSAKFAVQSGNGGTVEAEVEDKRPETEEEAKIMIAKRNAQGCSLQHAPGT